MNHYEFLCKNEMAFIFIKLMLQLTSQVSMFHRAFFNSIIDKHQHMHFTFNTILV